MTLTAATFLIVCPFLFLAGLIDAIGGGGGFISIPAYIFAGLPPHAAIATNKFSSACGTSVATILIVKKVKPKTALVIAGTILAVCGSGIGAKLSLLVSEKILMLVMIAVIPIFFFIVISKRFFKDREDEITKKTYIATGIIAFAVGIYDGFYGPGTGTILLVLLNVFAGLGIATAAAQTKVINLTTNVAALAVFLINGQVVLPLALAAAACNMAGGFIGAKLMLKNPAKIVRPVILAVLMIFLIRVIADLL